MMALLTNAQRPTSMATSHDASPRQRLYALGYVPHLGHAQRSADVIRFTRARPAPVTGMVSDLLPPRPFVSLDCPFHDIDHAHAACDLAS